MTGQHADARPWPGLLRSQLSDSGVGQWLAAIDVFNLTDIKWNDIEYYYVSRLKNETSPTPDFVVHPGVPLTVRAHFQYILGR